jgi:hypothetical protein
MPPFHQLQDSYLTPLKGEYGLTVRKTLAAGRPTKCTFQTDNPIWWLVTRLLSLPPESK